MSMSKAKSIDKALVIVDMQEDSLHMIDSDSAMDTLLSGILREVKEAKSKRIPIICLTYANQEDGFDDPKESWEYHATIPEIRNALKGYSRVYHAQKDDDGGGEMVMDILEGVEPRLGLEKPSFRGKPNKLRKFNMTEGIIDFTVVGVNASACVAATCGGLVDSWHMCRVPADAALNVWDCSFADNLDDDALDFDGVRITNMKRAAAA